MTGRERMLTALSNGRSDRLPCQVHGWMPYYLNRYLGSTDWMEADDRFGFDHALYISPDYVYFDRDLANWKTKVLDLGMLKDGYRHSVETIETPEGMLAHGTPGKQ